MSYKVYLTADANRDMEELDSYLAPADSSEKADYVLAKMDDIFRSLEKSPERGVHPKELLDLGMREYRQVFFKPYRIIYTVRKDAVFVYLIADGRRDMESLLLSRLLGK